MTKKKIYFGYGSNLNERDWNSSGKYSPWSEVLRILEPAYLLDYAPVYHYYSGGRGGGALDVYPRKGRFVEGMLFIPTEIGWQEVNLKEGSPNYYTQTEVQVQTKSGKIVSALTYIVNPDKRKKEFIAPSETYANLVNEGMISLGLNPNGQNAAAINDGEAGICKHIFVYGTLRQGGERESAMKQGRTENPELGKIRGKLVNLGNYPGLIEGEGEVVGEIHTYDDIDSALNRLDQIEGFHSHGYQNNLFERVICDVITNDKVLQAWTYRWNDSNGEIIDSGDWNKR